MQGSNPERTILINAGNNSNYQSLMAAVEYKYIVAGLDRSGFDAIGLGVWDAALGLDTVTAVAAGSPTDIICANVEGFVPFLRFNKAAGKVLVTSVIDPKLIELFKLKKVVVSDPIKAISRLQREIKHDIFILILHAQGERIHELLAQISGVDLVIDGETGRIEKKTLEVYGKSVARNNFGGKYVSYVDLIQDDRKSHLQVSQPVLSRVSAKTVAEDPEIKILVSQYEEERRLFIKKEQERRRKAAMKHRKPVNLYLGSGWCGSCHGEIEKKWSESHHAQAIKSLEKKKREFDLECLTCHVTGLGDKSAVGGFVSLEASSKMVGVQCEACHGPGGKHAQSPLKTKMKLVTEKNCRICHNHDTDPDFSFARDYKKVDHGKDIKDAK